jgi:hypothetical protein
MLENLFKSEADVKRLKLASKAAQFEQEKILKRNGIDPTKLKKRLREKGELDAVTFKDVLKESLNDLKHSNLQDSIEIIVAVLIVVAINTMFFQLFLPITGAELAMFLTPVLIAPFTEEIFKRYTVSRRLTIQGYLAFNILEFSIYVTRYADQVGLFTIIVVRLIAAGMHLFNTYIHKKADMEEKMLQDRGITDADLKGKAQKVAIGVHMGWNALGPVGSLLGYLVATYTNKNTIKEKYARKTEI